MMSRLLVSFGVGVLLLFCSINESKGSPHGCVSHIQNYEQQYQIPSGLLHAISKVESGRKDEGGHLIPWPWTINVDGKGYFFPTKEEAIEAVLALQEKGIKKIDVGCMQVNLHYHPKAFDSLEEAFEPQHNVAYAARFLSNLQKELKSWYKAMGHYNTANPLNHVSYQKNVMAMWKKEDGREGFARVAKWTDNEEGRWQSRHIRRLTSAKTLKLGSMPSQAKYEGAACRRITNGNSSRVRRLKLSSRK